MSKGQQISIDGQTVTIEATGAHSATAHNGRVIIGDVVRLTTCMRLDDDGPNDLLGPWVKVVSIVRKGYNGTILHTDPAPDPTFPHHRQGVARDFEKK